MSQSQQFANYSNSSQTLKSRVDQLESTTEQTTDDAKQFEAEYLTGIAVAAKTKLADSLIGLLKKSKGVKAAGKVVEDAKKGANQKINDLADNLTSKIPKLDSAAPVLSQTASPEKLAQLKTIANAATEKASGTAEALESAQNEVIDARDAVRVAGEARDSAQALSATRDAELVAKAGGPISSAEQQAATDARLALNEARSGVDSAASRSAAAESNVQTLAQQSQAHAGEAERAATDLKNASSAESEVVPVVSDTEKAIATAAKLEKAAKITKDVEEVSEAGDGADPVGIIFTALTAIATTIIGRRLKVHQNTITSNLPKGATLNFGATLGA
mgnify:CR=1 FL=1|tara:strand:+ start:354 stop:1349 length:996 start_codon:yes stop_codon:yes gene_type:complete